MHILGGLALKTLFPRVKRNTLTLIAGLIGTIIAASGIIFKFQDFLSILSMTVSSIAGVMWVEYYIINKQRLIKRAGINWGAMVSWIIGFGISYITTKINFGVPPINGIVFAGLLYYVIIKGTSKDRVTS
jgi:Permease for cytosine/purines, uracil, thiamine, allantoin.